MAESSVADVAVGFEWTPFQHGYVYLDYPGSEHLPPPDEAGQREWLEGFLQCHADIPMDDHSEDAHKTLRRALTGKFDVRSLIKLLNRMRSERREASGAGAGRVRP